MKDFPINLVTDLVPYIGIGHGLIGITLFRFRNSNRDYLNLISIATGLLFLTEVFVFKTTQTIALITWLIAGLGLAVGYGLRFMKKSSREIIDYLKLIAVGLVICYPINFYGYVLYSNKWDILLAIGPLIVPISGTIYFYDRWILKPEKMKRKFVTVLVIQTILILIALVYAFVKNIENVRMTKMAIENEKKYIESENRVIELREKLENCR